VKAAGLSLIAIAFLAGSWVSVLHAENEVPWAWYVPAFAVGVAGVAIARVGGRRAVGHADVVAGRFRTVVESIERIAERIDDLNRNKLTIDVYDLHGKIDELFPEHLTAFVDARESIIHRHGLQTYADIMNEFAAGERYLNRVWSASVDGYVDECHQYLEAARVQFEGAREALRRIDVGD